MKLERILVGCGLSEGEDAVWQTALDLALIHGSQVRAVHVLGGESLLGGRASEVYAQSALEALARRGREAGVNTDPPQVLSGKPTAALLEHAKAWEASWVVIGAVQRAGWERLLGSCAEALCRENTVPTLLVPPKGRPAWKRLLCAIDGTDPSRVALSIALDLARTYSAHLSLLYVEDDEAERLLAAEAVMRSLGLHEVEADVLIRRGPAVDEVIAAAQQETQADVLVIGTAGRTGLQRMLRPNTAESLLRRLPCALVVAPASDPA